MMTETELIRKVRLIELKTRGLTNEVFSGEYHSAFKGRGMTFSEVREYQPGDDIRMIDWNVTARFNHPFVKVFQEERELTVMLLVDISRSGNFGTHLQPKQELMTEIAAVLSLSASNNNDKAGMIQFSDKVEKFLAPKKGRTHILRIIRECLSAEAEGKGTNLDCALDYCNNTIKHRSILFIISDFMTGTYEKALRVAARRHDVIALNIYDRREHTLPDIGVVQIQDAETGEHVWVDTSDPVVRKNFERTAQMHKYYLEDLFRKCGIDYAHITPGDNYGKIISGLFRKREKRR